MKRVSEPSPDGDFNLKGPDWGGRGPEVPGRGVAHNSGWREEVGSSLGQGQTPV